MNDKGIYSCVATNAGLFKADTDTFLKAKGKSPVRRRERTITFEPTIYLTMSRRMRITTSSVRMILSNV